MITCNKIKRDHEHANPAEHTFSSFENATQQLNQTVNETLEHPTDTITLNETDRRRRRFLMKSDAGIEFLLDLQSVTLLKHDDILCLSDGRNVRVQAMPEPLYEVYGKNTTHLLVLTWHVGNRHLATQIMPDHIRIRRDPVIRTMLKQLGATIKDIQAGFNPESGAYGDAPAHHHQHD